MGQDEQEAPEHRHIRKWNALSNSPDSAKKAIDHQEEQADSCHPEATRNPGRSKENPKFPNKIPGRKLKPLILLGFLWCEGGDSNPYTCYGVRT
jgi:hypothetical protein